MLSLNQIQELRQVLDEITDRIRDNIRNKPIDRRTPNGSFSAPVNASGRLADSIEYEIGDNIITFYALDYIDSLIYGRKPGSFPPIFEIDNWIGIKGLNLNTFAVAENIYKHGTSIWQEHQGRDSGLLEEFVYEGVVNPKLIDEITERVMQYDIDKITMDILDSLQEIRRQNNKAA